MSGSTKTVSQTGGTKQGDSSVLPKSSTSSDHTNPTKTSSDAPPLDHDTVDIKNKNTDKQQRTTSSSSSSGSNQQQQSFLSSPIGKFGTLAVLTVAICKLGFWIFQFERLF
jgi:cobalamin biosynthesis Mg chelatase CobN